jgi:hypothetical protein
MIKQPGEGTVARGRRLTDVARRIIEKLVVNASSNRGGRINSPEPPEFAVFGE